MLNYRRQKFWVLTLSIIILIGVGMMLLLSPIKTEQDLSFLKPSNILSVIADKEQVKITSSDYNETFVSGTELAKWLDEAENEWTRKNISSPYELSPSIVIHINDETKNEIRFYETEPTLVMVLYQDEYSYYRIPKEDYLAVAAIARLGYPSIQHMSGDRVGASYFVYAENDNTYYIDAPYDHINKIDYNILKSIVSIFCIRRYTGSGCYKSIYI